MQSVAIHQRTTPESPAAPCQCLLPNPISLSVSGAKKHGCSRQQLLLKLTPRLLKHGSVFFLKKRILLLEACWTQKKAKKSWEKLPKGDGRWRLKTKARGEREQEIRLITWEVRIWLIVLNPGEKSTQSSFSVFLAVMCGRGGTVVFYCGVGKWIHNDYCPTFRMGTVLTKLFKMEEYSKFLTL